MKDIFCLWSEPQKGVPVFLDGILAEQFNSEDPMAPGIYEWANTRGKKHVNYPDYLWLICKEKLLLFDYFPFGSGFLVSKAFLAILEKYLTLDEIQYVPLKVCSQKGTEITDKAYFYLRFIVKLDLINYKESKFMIKKDADEALITKLGFGIERFEKIVINEVEKDAFIPTTITFSKYIFCSEKLKGELLTARMYGFDIIYYFELPLLYNERYG